MLSWRNPWVQKCAHTGRRRASGLVATSIVWNEPALFDYALFTWRRHRSRSGGFERPARIIDREQDRLVTRAATRRRVSRCASGVRPRTRLLCGRAAPARSMGQKAESVRKEPGFVCPIDSRAPARARGVLDRTASAVPSHAAVTPRSVYTSTTRAVRAVLTAILYPVQQFIGDPAITISGTGDPPPPALSHLPGLITRSALIGPDGSVVPVICNGMFRSAPSKWVDRPRSRAAESGASCARAVLSSGCVALLNIHARVRRGRLPFTSQRAVHRARGLPLLLARRSRAPSRFMAARSSPYDRQPAAPRPSSPRTRSATTGSVAFSTRPCLERADDHDRDCASASGRVPQLPVFVQGRTRRRRPFPRARLPFEVVRRAMIAGSSRRNRGHVPYPLSARGRRT